MTPSIRGNQLHCLISPTRTTACLALLLIVLLPLSARGPVEGDDINCMLPMLHLNSVLAGDLESYRMGWQPLAYYIGSFAYHATGNPLAITMLAPLAASMSMLIILHIMAAYAKSRSTCIQHISLLILIPELWLSGLYFNSTILGMPAAAGAWLIIRKSSRLPTHAAAGAILAIATLIRLDWLLAGPMLCAIALREHGWRSMLAFAAAFATTLAAAIATQTLSIHQVLAIHATSTAELTAKATTPGWDLRTKLGVALICIHPLGLAAAGIGTLVLARREWRRSRTGFLAFGAATLPLIAPTRDLLSPKYALPLMLFLVPAILTAHNKLFSSLQRPAKPKHFLPAIAAAITALAISIEPTKTPPFLRVTASEPRLVGTHDGPRTLGAYLTSAGHLTNFAHNTELQESCLAIIDYLESNQGAHLLLLGAQNYHLPGGVGWRRVAWLLEVAGIKGRVNMRGVMTYETGKYQLTLATSLAAARGAIDTDLRPHPLIIDLSNDDLTPQMIYETVQRALRSAK